MTLFAATTAFFVFIFVVIGNYAGRRVKTLELRDGDRVQFAPASDTGAPFLEFEQATQRHRHRFERSLGLVVLACLGGGGILLLLSILNMPLCF